MPSAAAYALVLVTAPDRNLARALAAAALQARLAACVNLLPGLESHYWWQGRLERSAEVLLMFKTRRSLVPALERLVSEKHPYDTPEFLVLPVTAGSSRYLAWLGESVRGAQAPGRRTKRG
jgi:periplasmic divalent cation tolerance protein